MKWLVIVVVLLVLIVAAFRISVVVGNRKVAEDLRAHPGGQRAARAMLLTFPDGRVLPVNYLWEGRQVFAGADGPWWRAFRAGDVPVQLEIRGRTLRGRARVVLDDPDYTHAIFARLRPTVPDWLPDWLDARLVVIDLDEDHMQ